MKKDIKPAEKQEASEFKIKLEKEELRELTGGFANQDYPLTDKSRKKPLSHTAKDGDYTPLELPEVP